MNKLTLGIAAGCFLLGGIGVTHAQPSASFTLPTPWTETAYRAEIPLPEYPRPQMVRDQWMSLNGTWAYMGGAQLANPATAPAPPVFGANTEKIRVPYPPEAELSGIRRQGEINLWYRRTLEVPKNWAGKNVLLHFGAVDRIAAVFLNGKKLGTHTGGYTSFSFNITSYLKPGENTLVVGAWDPNDGKAACGKNGPRGDYTFTSGIWQGVWMEPVGESHITHVKLIPDLTNNRLEIEVTATGKNLQVSAAAFDGSREVAQAAGSAGTKFYLPVPNPKRWSPDDPFLYDLKLQLKDGKGKAVDQIGSYFGMRSISLGKVDGKTRALLNGRFVLQLGLLDQGYWPDGILTAPTDEALRYDIGLAKRNGFNVIRKHIKVEPMRWYYHCDRMGLLVWQDMPNLWEPDGADSVAIRGQFRKEWGEIMDQLISVPAIVTWVPFNENWGAFDVTDITDWTKKHDPSRLVNGNCGYNFAPGYRRAYGDPGNGSFADMHNYGPIDETHTAKPDDTRAASIGEFGGKGLFVRGHMWPVRNNAYEVLVNKDILSDTYVTLLTEVEQMMTYQGVSSAIYTQTTDVEHEINGLVTYDRQVEKMDFNKVRSINEAIIQSSQALNNQATGYRTPRVYPKAPRQPGIDGYTVWQTGHDAQTVQVIPETGGNALMQGVDAPVAHAKFIVHEYGELWFALANTPPQVESAGADVSQGASITVTYKANQDVILQLRQTGVHGGIQNHVTLPASEQVTTTTIPFTQFSGGLRPLNLADVAKANFAFLANNARDGYAELYIYHVAVDRYSPPQ